LYTEKNSVKIVSGDTINRKIWWSMCRKTITGTVHSRPLHAAAVNVDVIQITSKEAMESL
jgi:hypothetical protein